MSVAKVNVIDLDFGIEDKSEVNLESTVGAFATRIARKLKERDAQQSEAKKAAEVRHNLILEAMNTIRKALQETLRINLGERFNLDLWVDDWDGWPRVKLVLVDRCAPKRVDYALIVTANDRKDTGQIEMVQSNGLVLAKIELHERSEITRLALSLKKAVRQFLDSVAAYVLNPVRPEDMIETLSKPLETDEQELDNPKLKNADLFSENADYSKQNVIKVEESAHKEGLLQEVDLFK